MDAHCVGPLAFRRDEGQHGGRQQATATLFIVTTSGSSNGENRFVQPRAVPSPPGTSLVPAFTTDGSVAHDYLWWLHERNRAIRVGDWKLVAAGREGPWELYDLAADRAETNNLAAKHPNKVRELAREWQRHFDEFRKLAAEDLSTDR